MQDRFSFRFGTMNDVLGGRGEEVESFEDIYGTKKGIIVPNIIGVSQGSGSSVVRMFGAPENEVDPCMIAVVYSPGDFPVPRFLKEMVDERNSFKRVACLSYEQAGSPDYFLKKPVLTGERLTSLAKAYCESSAANRSLSVIERELEHYSLIERDFGLTLIEALNKRILASNIGLLGALPSVESLAGEQDE